MDILLKYLWNVLVLKNLGNSSKVSGFVNE